MGARVSRPAPVPPLQEPPQPPQPPQSQPQRPVLFAFQRVRAFVACNRDKIRTHWQEFVHDSRGRAKVNCLHLANAVHAEWAKDTGDKSHVFLAGTTYSACFLSYITRDQCDASLLGIMCVRALFYPAMLDFLENCFRVFAEDGPPASLDHMYNVLKALGVLVTDIVEGNSRLHYHEMIASLFMFGDAWVLLAQRVLQEEPWLHVVDPNMWYVLGVTVLQIVGTHVNVHPMSCPDRATWRPQWGPRWTIEGARSAFPLVHWCKVWAKVLPMLKRSTTDAATWKALVVSLFTALCRHWAVLTSSDFYCVDAGSLWAHVLPEIAAQREWLSDVVQEFGATSYPVQIATALKYFKKQTSTRSSAALVVLTGLMEVFLREAGPDQVTLGDVWFWVDLFREQTCERFSSIDDCSFICELDLTRVREFATVLCRMVEVHCANAYHALAQVRDRWRRGVAYVSEPTYPNTILFLAEHVHDATPFLTLPSVDKERLTVLASQQREWSHLRRVWISVVVASELPRRSNNCRHPPRSRATHGVHGHLVGGCPEAQGTAVHDPSANAQTRDGSLQAAVPPLYMSAKCT